MTDLEAREVHAPEARPGDEGRDPLGGARLLALAFGAWLVANVLAGIFAAVTLAIRGEEVVQGVQPSQPVTSAGQVGLALVFLGVPLAVAVRRAGGWSGALRRLGLRFRWVDLPLGIAVGVVSTIVTTLLYLPFSSLTDKDDLEKPARDMVDAARHVQGGVALLVVSVCVIAPLAEEIFFRGLVFRASARLAGLWPGIVLGGLLFGLGHFELLQLAGLAVFGAILCFTFHRTGRLGTCIVAHCAFNAITVVQLLAR